MVNVVVVVVLVHVRLVKMMVLMVEMVVVVCSSIEMPFVACCLHVQRSFNYRLAILTA